LTGWKSIPSPHSTNSAPRTHLPQCALRATLSAGC
jgi:hypothetical protein